MYKMQEKCNAGSATIEMTIVVGMILVIIFMTINTAFFIHDTTVRNAQVDYHSVEGEQNYSQIKLYTKSVTVKKGTKKESTDELRKKKVLIDGAGAIKDILSE